MKQNLFSGWLLSLRKAVACGNISLMRHNFYTVSRIAFVVIFFAGMITTFDSCSKSDIDDPEYIEKPQPDKEKPGDNDDDNSGDKNDNNSGDKDDDNSSDKDDDNSGNNDDNIQNGYYSDAKGDRYYCDFSKGTGILTEVAGVKNLHNYKIDDTATVIVDEKKYNVDSTIGTKQVRVTGIGDEVFYLARNLKSASIPNSVTSIGKRAFTGCKSLKNIILSNSLTTISREMFLNCPHLETLKIPDSVTIIEKEALPYNLKKLVLGTSIEKVDSSIPSTLEELYCYAKTPPALKDGIYDDHKFVLYVPKDAVESYSQSKWYGANITIKAME